jgi:hypothetical protein
MSFSHYVSFSLAILADQLGIFRQMNVVFPTTSGVVTSTI